jgi:hypothetical protein
MLSLLSNVGVELGRVGKGWEKSIMLKEGK